jgi:hypothetical protein
VTAAAQGGGAGRRCRARKGWVAAQGRAAVQCAGAASHGWRWKSSTGVAARALCVRLGSSLVWHIVSSNSSGSWPSVQPAHLLP